MGNETPIRNQFGTIIGLQPKGEADAVQEVLDASMQAVGAMPEVQPPITTPAKRPLPPLPSFRLEIVVLVVCLAVVGLTFLPRRAAAPTQTSLPTITVEPTTTPRPTVTPTILINPHSVTLSAITLYGDYDEATRIGNAPDGAVCLFDGHSPDEAWVFLNCPAPVGYVWAKLSELKLSDAQRAVLKVVQVVARVVVPTPMRQPVNVFTPPPSLPFCADRYSQWGNTHQCSTDQLTAENLAEAEIAKINATAEAIHNATK